MKISIVPKKIKARHMAYSITRLDPNKLFFWKVLIVSANTFQFVDSEPKCQIKEML